MEGLGRLFDISPGFINQVVNNNADVTGMRVSLEDCGGCTIVVVSGAGSGGDDLDLDLQQHTAYTGGTTADLDIIDSYCYKTETALDGDEAWVRATQTAASEITDATGAAGTSAEQQQIVVIEVEAHQLTDGYTHISLDTRNCGASNDKTATVLYLLRDLKVQRDPANLPNRLHPGAANA